MDGHRRPPTSGDGRRRADGPRQRRALAPSSRSTCSTTTSGSGSCSARPRWSRGWSSRRSPRPAVRTATRSRRRRRAPSRARRPTWPRPSRRPATRRRRRPRPTSSPAPSPWPTRTGCTPGPPRGWCRRCAALDARVALRNRTTGIGVGAGGQPVAGGHARRAARPRRRGQRRAAPGPRGARPPARRWPPATSTSRWTARRRHAGCTGGDAERGPCRLGRGRCGADRDRPDPRVARRGHRPGVVAAARTDRPHRDRGGRPGRRVARGSPRRSRPSGADVSQVRARAAREVGEAEAAHLRRAPPAARRRRPARRRPRPDRRRCSPPRAAWAAAVDAVAGDLAALPDPYLRARAADVARRGRRRCCASCSGVGRATAPRRAACWSPPT